MDQSLDYYKSLLSDTETGATLPIQQNQNDASFIGQDDEIN